MTDQRISYKGKVYALTTLDELSLDDLIAFEEETAAAGSPMTIMDAEKINTRSALAMAIGMWAAIRAAGEKITFAEARQIRMKDIVNIPTPADHKGKSGPKAKQAAKPKSSHSTGTGQDARNEEPETPPTIRSVAS